MAVVFNKFNAWAENMVEVANLGTDQFIIALTNTAPVAANSVLADITQISYTNLSSRNVTTTSSSQTGGTYTLVLADRWARFVMSFFTTIRLLPQTSRWRGGGTTDRLLRWRTVRRSL
jgi:hypothetical protein